MTEGQAAKKIIIIDDDRASRVLMRTMLQTLDPPCEISEAIGGQQGMRMIETGRPDLVLLDVLMPDIDGISICSKLKHDFSTRAIKVLMVTARRDERMIRAGILAGADDYITKPFTQEQFLGVIKRLLE